MKKVSAAIIAIVGFVVIAKAIFVVSPLMVVPGILMVVAAFEISVID